MNWNDLTILDFVNLIANMEQLAQDNTQSTNDDIMKALQSQTKTLLDNMNDKLDTIILNQEKILKTIEG